MGMAIKVSSCGDCPFYEYQDEMQTQSCRLDENISFIYKKRYQSGRLNQKFFNHDINGIHPNCPMRTENEVIISIQLPTK